MRKQDFFRLLILLSGAFVFILLAGRLVTPKSQALLASSSKTELVPVPQALADLQGAFRSIARNVQPAVVNISAYHEESVQAPEEYYFMDPEEFFYEFFHGAPQQRKPRAFKRQYSGTGSGVLIDEQGLVLTNTHVIADAEDIKVRLTNADGQKTYKAKVIGRDERLDLALLKIEGGDPFPCVSLGDSDQVQVGDWAVAVGSPFDLEQTFTVGVISALRHSVAIQGRTYRNMLQTDAAINRGNSGGPLLNIKGEVIGINTAIFSPSGVFAGIGFSIPINSAKEILEDLKRGREKQWGWLGVSVAEVNEVIAKRFGLAKAEGALINDVFKNSPAQKAGLERGDVIIRLNSNPIKNPLALTEAIRHVEPGKKVKVAFIREAKENEAVVQLTARPKWADIGGQGPSFEEEAPEKEELEKSEEPKVQWQGLRVEALNSSRGKRLAEAYKVPESRQEGVIVSVVEPSSAINNYLEEGDIILGINKERIKNLDDFRKAISTARLKDGVVFDILRRGSLQFISVQSAE